MKGASIKLLFIGLSVLAVSRFTSCRHAPVVQAAAPKNTTSPAPETGEIWMDSIPAGCGAGMAPKLYRQLITTWRKREGLEQWNIQLRLVRPGVLYKRTIDGDVSWPEYGTARIRVLCPADIEDLGFNPVKETELVLVHELMHIVLGRMDDDKREFSEAEQKSVEVVTEAFAKTLLNRRVPGGISEALYINREINSGPWHPAPEVKKEVMLQIIRAIHATSEDDVTTLLARN